MSEAQIKVAIVEDDDVLREAITFLLGSTEGIQVVGSYGTGEQALADVAENPPNIVLMDILLPGISGIECLKRMRQILPDVNVVMLTVLEENEKVFQSLMAGAHGYILKKAPREKLTEAIREVWNGGAPMTPQIARQVLEFFSVLPRASEVELLTRRENEILDLLAKGHTHKEIADSLFISPATVRTHLKNIYEKLHVHSRSEAVAKLLRPRFKGS
jgi:DNA-binding NarL/FixJ family response regulator